MGSSYVGVCEHCHHEIWVGDWGGPIEYGHKGSCRMVKRGYAMK